MFLAKNLTKIKLKIRIFTSKFVKHFYKFNLMQQSNKYPFGPTKFELKYGNNITRIFAVIAIPIVLLCVSLGGYWFLTFMMIISSIALIEFYWLCESKELYPNIFLGVIASLVLQYIFSVHSVDKITFVLIPLFVVTMSVELFRNKNNSILNVASTLAGVMYISLSMACFTEIRYYFNDNLDSTIFHTNNLDIGIVFAILISIWVCDSFAYFVGRKFGKHKLSERISPKKSWEGTIAGAIGSVVSMFLVQRFWLVDLSIFDSIVIGLIAGIFGQLGDLSESMLKRSARIKDSSQILPGHGGVLDRFDSLLFVSPLVYIYLNIK